MSGAFSASLSLLGRSSFFIIKKALGKGRKKKERFNMTEQTGQQNMAAASKTLKVVKMGVTVAISAALVYLIHFPIFPVVSFLEYDPADIPILIGTFAFGPLAGLVLTVVTSVVQGLTVSAGSGLYGILMHVIATGVLVAVSGGIYSRNKTRKTAVIALVCGMAAMAVVMMGANMVITPIFMGVPASAVWDLMPFIVGFNVIKAGINGAVTFILYKRIANFLRR